MGSLGHSPRPKSLLQKDLWKVFKLDLYLNVEIACKIRGNKMEKIYLKVWDEDLFYGYITGEDNWTKDKTKAISFDDYFRAKVRADRLQKQFNDEIKLEREAA